MKIKYGILLLASTLAACASGPQQPRQPTLDERIEQAAKTVNIINPKATNWCQPAKSCTLVTQVFCTDHHANPSETCQKDITKQVVQNGGDTFVAQDAGILKGVSNVYNNNYYRIYGQVYKCSDKNNELHQEYDNNNGPATKAPILFKSDEYVKQCGGMNNCEVVEQQACSSIGVNPFKLCVEKYNRNTLRRGHNVNQIVVKEEVFNRIGSYRIFVDSYNCK